MGWHVGYPPYDSAINLDLHFRLSQFCLSSYFGTDYNYVVAHYGTISHKNRHNSEQSFLPSSSFESSLVKHFLIMLNTAE